MTSTSTMHVRRFVFDTLIGLGIISFALVATLFGTSPAGAFETAVVTLAEDRWLPLTMIATMFSLFVAFNLALYRHVCGIYAEEKPLRLQSGRGQGS